MSRSGNKDTKSVSGLCWTLSGVSGVESVSPKYPILWFRRARFFVDLLCIPACATARDLLCLEGPFDPAPRPPGRRTLAEGGKKRHGSISGPVLHPQVLFMGGACPMRTPSGFGAEIWGIPLGAGGVALALALAPAPRRTTRPSERAFVNSCVKKLCS